MSKTLAISVPDEVHDALSARARKEGLGIEALVAREIEKQITEELTPEELLERLHRIGTLDLGNLTIADLIREGREERGDQIIDAISRR